MRLGMRAKFNRGERVQVASGEYAGLFGTVIHAPEGTIFNRKKEIYILLDDGRAIIKRKNEVYKR